MFSMFEKSLTVGDVNVDEVSLMCIKCKRLTGFKKNNRIDDFEYWPVSIKSTIQWFPFLEIMEYTGNDMKNDTNITS